VKKNCLFPAVLWLFSTDVYRYPILTLSGVEMGMPEQATKTLPTVEEAAHRLETVFGEDKFVPMQQVPAAVRPATKAFLLSQEFEDWMEDVLNQHIIRSYVISAISNNLFTQTDLAGCLSCSQTPESRAELAELLMLVGLAGASTIGGNVKQLLASPAGVLIAANTMLH
jgi:hypothetical protein